MELQVKKLYEDANLPERAHDTDVGYDLFAHTEKQIVIQPANSMSIGRKPVPTGIAIAIPLGHYGRIAPKSGLAVNKGIDILAGVVDPGYRGEVIVMVVNFGIEPFSIKNGDKIAQLICEHIGLPKVVEVAELPEADRGVGGFGSTGRHSKEQIKAEMVTLMQNEPKISGKRLAEMLSINEKTAFRYRKELTEAQAKELENGIQSMIP